jgi:hypothetical protein
MRAAVPLRRHFIGISPSLLNTNFDKAGVISFQDLIIARSRFGIKPKDDRWNQVAGSYWNGIIDILDPTMVASDNREGDPANCACAQNTYSRQLATGCSGFLPFFQYLKSWLPFLPQFFEMFVQNSTERRQTNPDCQLKAFFW